MKAHRWLLLAGAAFACMQLNAQAKLGLIIDSFPTQVLVYDTNAYYRNVYIKNYGNTVFNDTVRMQYLINGSLQSGSVYDAGFYLKPDTAYIAPGDSALKQLTVQFNTSPLEMIGSSVVVIWPISQTAVTYDSSSYRVQITDTLDTVSAGVNPIIDKNLRVYISQQQLFINTGGTNILKQVSVYDLQGKMLIEKSALSSTVIPFEEYTEGCYLVQLTFYDNSRKAFKIINTGGR